MTALAEYGWQLGMGAALTVALALASTVAGCLLGLLGAAMKLSGSRAARYAAEVYTTVIRGLPDLLLILIVYFGGTVALTALVGRYVDVGPFPAGVAALAIVFGGYATEIFRGAVLAVPPGQSEAGRSLGLSPRLVVALIVLPQAARHAVPALGNLSIVLLKETSLVSVIGLEELMRTSSIAAGATREPFVFYAAAAGIYLVLTGLMTWGLERAERRAARGLAGA